MSVSTATSETLDVPLEEETLPGYVAHEFYPAKIGAIIDSRYTILGKLGYGANSTVWLCRDSEWVEYCRSSITEILMALTQITGYRMSQDIPQHHE